MRWILAFLLILNGIFFWWYAYQENDDVVNEIVDARSKLPVLDDNTTKLQLLSELPEKEKIEVPQALSSNDSDIAPIPPEKKSLDIGESDLTSAKIEEDKPAVCGMIGPFNDVVSAKQLKNRLEALDMDGDLRRERQEIAPIYWVYLEPMKSRKEALAVLRELQAKQIDSFMIGQGDLQYGISLGFFKQESSAKLVERSRIKEGYDAKIRIKKRSRDFYWFVLQPQVMAKMSETLFKKLTADFKLLQKKQNLCSHVASLEYIE